MYFENQKCQQHGRTISGDSTKVEKFNKNVWETYERCLEWEQDSKGNTNV